MQNIVLIGAGAINRGFIPWILPDNKYEFIYVDVDPFIISTLKQNKQFTTYCSKNGKLEKKIVPVKEAYLLEEFNFKNIKNVLVIFISVGPRNCLHAASVLKETNVDIILLENDPETVNIVKNSLNYNKVYFGIPDVITSNTSSEEVLKLNPLAINTEDGVLFVDNGADKIFGNINYCSKEELEKQWTAKLYLHNTPHCIAAYLGSLMGVKYLHDAMNYPKIYKIVEGAMNEMLMALKSRWDIAHPFLEWYSEKELRRFSNELLCDPISRVAREPLRKLELDGRLIGAAQICLSVGFTPDNILTGIVSALLFVNKNDPDNHLEFMRKAFSSRMLMTYILGLRKGEALEIILEERFESIAKNLEKIINE
ncbi:MAG: hypothetical protein WC223_02375 [Bacteroidales bacterium]|jgi:mannitol-1-phosphate/altronate dehydrogenase